MFMSCTSANIACQLRLAFQIVQCCYSFLFCFFYYRVGAAVPVIYTYFIEFLTKEKRGPLLGLVSTFWMLGGILTSLIAWLIIPRTYLGSYLGKLWYGSWRLFVAVCSFPAFTAALFLFLMPESPKYLQEVIIYWYTFVLDSSKCFLMQLPWLFFYR